MKASLYRRVKALCCIALRIALGLVATGSVSAVNPSSFHFHIAADKLVDALIQWSQITQTSYIAKPETLEGLKAVPVMGEKPKEQALAELLHDTGLEFRRLASGTYLIAPRVYPDSRPRNLTEVIVTGHKASLRRSLEFKMQSNEVVDVISAIDINRFPDANLAESLQRIAGVSIDRAGNEGNKVTVRGLGPDLNLVTRNGRRTPATAIPGINNINALAPASRSFEFINLASDGVDAVLVHKTSSANRPSGGIGAVIDVQTPRPIQFEHNFANVSLKALKDGSQNDIDPEYAFTAGAKLGETLGLYLSASRQERHSQFDQALINGWVDNSTAISEWYPNNSFEVSVSVSQDLNTHSDGLNWTPLSQSISTSEQFRTRDNVQFTAQVQPTETWLVSLDLSKQQLAVSPETELYQAPFFGIPRDQLFGQGLTASYDRNGTATELVKDNGLYHFQQSSVQITNEIQAAGLNIEYQVFPKLTLELDISDTEAEAQRAVHELKILQLGADTVTFDNGTEVPSLTFDISDPFGPANITTLTEPQPYTTFTQNLQHALFDTRFSGIFHSDYDPLKSVEFGIEQLNSQVTSDVREAVFVTDWQLAFDLNPRDNTPEDFFQRSYVGGILNDFEGGLDQQDYLYTSDFNPPQAQMRRLKDSSDIDCYCDESLGWHQIEENITALFAQARFNWDNRFAPTITAGLRVEQTDVTVNSLTDVPIAIEWANPSYTYVRYASSRELNTAQSDHLNFLPSVTARFSPFDATVVRLGVSRTIARSDLTQMRSQIQLSSDLQAVRAARSGNPGLKPYTSDNLDLSFEWYYAGSSYASLGLFAKAIDNFVAISSFDDTLFDLRDVYNGDRANQARAELSEEGLPLTNDNILDRIIANGGATGRTDSNGNPIVESNTTDPLIKWEVRQPQNLKSATISGLELSLQHMFGTSGWGSLFNYTFVDSDTDYALRELGYQFAIPGVSDTFNAVLFFENNGYDIRLAYNWRDRFLSALTTFTGDQPQFTEAYEQLDFSLTRQISDAFEIQLDIINMLGADQRIHSRYPEQLISASQFEPVYILGFNYEIGR